MSRFRSRFDWRQSASHILLLSQFQRAREEYRRGWLGGHTWEEWKAALNELPQKAIRRFLDDGVLEQANLEECLAHKFKVSDLKEMLKQRELSVSGPKADLIVRLIEADREGMRQAVSDLSLLQSTDQGRELVNEYLACEETRRIEMEQAVVEALHQRKFEESSRLVRSFDAEQVFPRGLDAFGNYALLYNIFARTPKVLAQLSSEQLEPLRVGAGMLVLGWDSRQVKDWLPSDLETGLQVSNLGAAMMLHSHAHYLVSMKSAHKYNKDGLFRGEISVQTANDHYVCPTCRELASRKYTIAEIPELPYEECAAKDGCRCWINVTPVVT